MISSLAVRTLALCLLLVGCTRDFVPPTDTVLLPIADRQWDTEAPPEGWCGEASIQMAAGHHGLFVSQRRANQLGQPRTPDLWEHDVPTALRALQMRFTRGPSSKPAKLLPWLVDELRAGHPVVLGVKVVPTAHPDWHVDHLVLAVGFTPQGLTLNSNMEDGQLTVSWAGLQRAEGEAGYSLVNQSGELFAYAVTGLYEGSTVPVSVNVVTQLGDDATVDVTVRDLREGQHYELLRDGVQQEVFTARKPSRSLRVVLSANTEVRFSARPVAAPK